MGENINELGYKNHDPFYYNLNKNFQYLMITVAETRRNLNMLEELYISIDTFYIFYSSYITKERKNIVDQLDVLKEFVYSSKYTELVKTQKSNSDFYMETSKMLLDSIKIIPLIMKELHDNQLFPHMTQVDKDIPSAVKNIK